MFCFQCQETAKNTGCTVNGMCGKPEETANLQAKSVGVLSSKNEDVRSLRELLVIGLKGINDLPISYDIAWYEQKAVAVLLALLALGVKGIRLGPALPGFLSPNVAKVLVEKFDIKSIGTVEDDVVAMMAGK